MIKSLNNKYKIKTKNSYISKIKTQNKSPNPKIYLKLQRNN